MKLCRDIVVFLAGASFFHLFSHAMIPMFMDLPLDMKIVVLTPELNNIAIGVNAVITLLLLWWAKRLGKKEWCCKEKCCCKEECCCKECPKCENDCKEKCEKA